MQTKESLGPLEGYVDYTEPPRKATPRSWKPEVITDDSGKWYGNALRFPTKEEAEGNVADLFSRWMLVRETRVMESDDPPNYRWVDGRPVRIQDGE